MTRQAVGKAIKAGRLPATRLGDGPYRITRPDLEHFKAARKLRKA